MTDQAGNSKKLFIPSLAGIYESLSPYADVLVRFTVGVIIMPHG